MYKSRQMKAVICPAYGPPEVLVLKEVEKPEVRDDEMRVKVLATAVNSGDTRVRGLAVEGITRVIMRFALGFTKPRKPVLGTVYSGIVESTGKDVTRFKVGDAVFGMTGFKFGTYAEYITVKETGNVLEKPVNASHQEAASIIFGGQSALYFLGNAGIEKSQGKKVLIAGATGAVGTAAVQVALHHGAEVTAVCSTAGKELMENLGLEQVIFYNEEDVTRRPDRFDIIFDAVGKYTKKQCQPLLKEGGVYKTVGGMDVASENVDQLRALKSLFEQGRLKAVIDKTFPLDRIVEAHRYVDTGRKKGSVVITL